MSFRGAGNGEGADRVYALLLLLLTSSHSAIPQSTACFNDPSHLSFTSLTSAQRSVYIGLRDVDPAEKRILRENKIKCFTMHDVDKYGIGQVVEMALDHVNKGRTRPVHLSFDVDATDPSVAGSESERGRGKALALRADDLRLGTGTPVRGGLSFREGHYICEAVAETGCLVALDIMVSAPSSLPSRGTPADTVAQEVNPTLGDAKLVEQTVAVGCSLTRAALGETLL